VLALLAVIGVAQAFLGFAILKEIAGLAALVRNAIGDGANQRDNVPDTLHPVVPRGLLRYQHEQFLRLRDQAVEGEAKLKNSGQLDVEPLPEHEMRDVISDYVRADDMDAAITLGLKLNSEVFAGRLTREEGTKARYARPSAIGFIFDETNRRTVEWAERLREIVRKKGKDNEAPKVK
jgi:hypothetical protein